MIGGGFLGGGISIVPAGKAIIYASLTTEDGANIPNAVFKATRTGSTVTVNGGVDGRAELLVDAGHTYTVTVTPAGGSYLNNSQTVATASAKSYAVEFYLYPSKANESSTTASLNALNSSISTHASNKSNPHSVTKAQVGLGNVDNTSDLAKPISTATQNALNAKAPTSHATTATTYGVGSTTNYGHVKVDSSLSGTSVNPVQNKAVKAELDTKALNTDLTSHTTSKTNPHSVSKAQVGLGSVDNTSDASKPISTATQTALNAKADASALGGYVSTTRKVNGKPLSADIALTFADVGALSADTHIPEGSVVDPDFSETSVNPIQNKVLTTRLKTLAAKAELEAHTGNTSNPHGVTKAQVGLGSVDNTSDTAKPISTATQTALNAKVNNTGNEDIAGVKNFLNPINIGRDRGGSAVLSLFNNNLGLTYEDIAGGARGIIGGVEGRPSGGRVTHYIDYRIESANSSIRMVTRRPSTTNAEVEAVAGLTANSEGDRWFSIPMRASPGSSDAVNVSYVLDRVAEMVGYVKLYHHSVRVYAEASKTFSVSIGIINNSSTPLNNVNALKAYLGSSANDYYPCSGMFWSADKVTAVMASDIRGDNIGKLRLRGVNMSSGGPTITRVVDSATEEVLVSDYVREIL